MRTDELAELTVDEDCTVIDAVAKIQAGKHRALLVVRGDKVLGTLSEGDVMRGLLEGNSVFSAISPLVRHSFKWLTRRDLGEAFRLFRRSRITLLPVVDEDMRLVDVVTLGDILDVVQLRAGGQ